MVTDTRIVDGAVCNIEIREYPNSSNANPAYSQAKLSNVTGLYNATSGCSATLAQNEQNQARWEFKVRITNPANAGNDYGSRTFGADPAYFMLYGAIGVTEISGV